MKRRNLWLIGLFALLAACVGLWFKTPSVVLHRSDVISKVRLGMSPEQMQASLNLPSGTINLWLKRPLGPAEYEAEIGELDWRSWLKDQERFTFSFDSNRKLVAAKVLTFRRQSYESRLDLTLDRLKERP